MTTLKMCDVLFLIFYILIVRIWGSLQQLWHNTMDYDVSLFRCSYCGGIGHTERDCQLCPALKRTSVNPAFLFNSNAICNRCNEIGHQDNDCPIPVTPMDNDGCLPSRHEIEDYCEYGMDVASTDSGSWVLWDQDTGTVPEEYSWEEEDAFWTYGNYVEGGAVDSLWVDGFYANGIWIEEEYLSGCWMNGTWIVAPYIPGFWIDFWWLENWNHVFMWGWMYQEKWWKFTDRS